VLLGLIAGSVFSLSAVALVVVYRATGILNFAQGAVGMFGTFTFVSMAPHQPIVVALPAGVAVAAVLGFVLWIMTAPLSEHRLEATVITLAMLGLLQAVAQLIFGGHPVALSRLFPTGAVTVFGTTIGSDELAAAACALALCGLVLVLMHRTGMGLVARAVASRPRVVAALGLDERPVVIGSWVVAGGLAGLAGILLLTLQPAPDTASLTLIVIDSFAAALFGRLVSIPWAIAGGLVIGVIEQLVEGLLAIPGAGEAAMFAAMIVLLGAYPPVAVRSLVQPKAF
jgi:sulfate-transporting ATPase